MLENEQLTQPATQLPDTLEHVMGQIISTATVDSVFGKPFERGETVVVPCSEMAVVLGMGFGSGSNSEHNQPNGSGGGGAGGTSRGRPIAAIIITGDKVRVKPIIDVTRISLAGMSTAAFIVFWIFRLVFGDRKSKGPSFGKLSRIMNR